MVIPRVVLSASAISLSSALISHAALRRALFNMASNSPHICPEFASTCADAIAIMRSTA